MPTTPRQAAAVLEKLAPLYPHHPLHVDAAQPFQVLVATILSARTQDPTTNAAMQRLWGRLEKGQTGSGDPPVAGLPARPLSTGRGRASKPGTATGVSPLLGPRDILAVPEDELAQLIKPVGFYLTKAKHLHEMARLLLGEFDGQVPRTRDDLLRLPGVGRKVANLVLNICYAEPAICVDVHVHRIANRLGWVATGTPEETEQALERLVPRRLWATLNRVLVNHGQQVCRPTSPRCSACVIAAQCPRIGVVRAR